MRGLALSDNIEIITRFEYAFRAGAEATIDELCDPGLLDHNPAPGQEPTLAGFKQKVAGFKAVFPDIGEELQVLASQLSFRRPSGWNDAELLHQAISSCPRP
jgi:hypothetical protein